MRIKLKKVVVPKKKNSKNGLHGLNETRTPIHSNEELQVNFEADLQPRTEETGDLQT